MKQMKKSFMPMSLPLAFFNCHVHIMYPVGFGANKEFTLMEKAFYAQKHCKEYLESGVTFIRIVDTEENYDLKLKKLLKIM